MIYIITHTYPEKNKMFSSYEFEYLQKRNEKYRVLSLSKIKNNDKNVINVDLKTGIKSLFKTLIWLKILPLIFKRSFKETLRNGYSMLMALSIYQTNKIEKNDLIFAYWMSRSSVIAYYLNILTTTPYIVQGHGSDIYIYPPFNLGKILKKSQKIYTVAKQNKKYLSEKYKINPNKIEVSYLGVAKEFAERDKVVKKDKKIKKFLTVGRYEEVKGIDILLKTINELVKENKIDEKIIFEIYGDGTQRKKYLDYIQVNKLEQNVTLHSWINRENLKKELGKADCYILPSRSEGLPVALMEAVAYSLPIIATNVGGVKEVAIEGKNAYLCEKESISSLKRKILEILSKGSVEIKKMSEESYQIYLNKFDFEINMDKKYDKIFGGKKC